MNKTTRTILATLTAAVLAGCATGGGASAKRSLKTCIVTDNALDSMGDEQSIVHNRQTVKFCCEPCVDKFRANPAKYLAKLPK